MADVFTKSDATISPCGSYRYWLERRWGHEPPQTFIMLNPSTADAAVDDRTIGRCIEFSKREGAGGLIVVNLFALRATNPKELDGHIDPVGPDNAKNIGIALIAAAAQNIPVICGWGGNKDAPKQALRLKARAKDFGVRLVALHVNHDGSPKHPLYINGEAPLIDFY
ncbi:DUF1643 domain-containing protein [Hoeflea ulvae]|uniref:DUF1643 domain-containing protein n=1 Tax=Hoeflea ulvae TaxID=2983764 RepID=A0ABT3YFP5_9HYPH|nr:DUF1643 domain-containing protein [Hoeflea ulvae]MCY0094717.1 DUF1643 domain-containing protein [Hoeflea ulvae]